MPIEYRIDHSRRLVVTTAAGILTADDLLNHQIRIHNDPNFDPLSSQLNDMRMADLTGLDADCVEILSQRSIPKGGSKIAFVVRNEIAKGLARMFEGFRDGMGEEYRVFSDLDSAYGWIDAAVEEPEALLTSPVRRRRTAPRVLADEHPRVPDHVYFIARDVEVSGQVLNISAIGAFIAGPFHDLEPMTEVELYFIQPGTRQRLQARGRVTRSNAQGFAVQFTRIAREFQKLVLDASEKVKDRKQ